jgi:hypothetical protein
VANSPLYTVFGSEDLVVTGAGIAGGSETLKMRFKPSLEGKYTVESKFPLAKDEVVLRLKPGQKWMDRSGLLFITEMVSGLFIMKVGAVVVAGVKEIEVDVFRRILNRFRSDSAAIPKRFRSDSAAIAKRMRSDFAAIGKRMRSECKSYAPRLKIGCEAIPQRYRSDCRAIVLITAPIPKKSAADPRRRRSD